MKVVAPTWLEYAALRLGAPGCRPAWGGLGLARWHAAAPGSLVVVCGLAGALVPELAPGTVLVPEAVGMPDGWLRPCDPAAVAALVSAARRLGFEPATGPLLTSPSLVTGDARAFWAERGFVAADMEVGLLPEGVRIATVRVILDTPARPISDRWVSPARALRTGEGWRELVWLSRAAPVYAWRAARVVAGVV